MWVAAAAAVAALWSKLSISQTDDDDLTAAVRALYGTRLSVSPRPPGFLWEAVTCASTTTTIATAARLVSRRAHLILVRRGPLVVERREP